MENSFTKIFNSNEFIFVYVVNIGFICDSEIYILTYLHTYTLNISLILTKSFLEAAVTIFNRKESSDIFLRLINETFAKNRVET